MLKKVYNMMHIIAKNKKIRKIKKNGHFRYLGSVPVLALRSKKAGRFKILLGFARSHSIVTRGSVSLSCATTPHPSYFSKS